MRIGPHVREWLLAPLLICLAGAGIELLETTPLRVPVPGPLLILGLIYATFRGGTGPGLLASLVFIVYHFLHYSRFSPFDPAAYIPDGFRQAVIMACIAPLVILLVGRLRSRSEHLAREMLAREKEIAVQDAVRKEIDKSQSDAMALLREANRVLEQAHDRAIETAHAKSLFLANAAHEFRTPLTATIGFCELVEEELEAGETAAALEDVRRARLAANVLLQLVNDILDAAQLEAGQMRISVERFDVELLTHQVAESVMRQVEEQGNTLTVECAGDVRVMESDPRKLRQILYNLLSNAAKFTRNGSIRFRLRRELHETGEMACFEIEDTGIGIAPEHLPRLFTEFYQIDFMPDPARPGTGLGLAIADRLCRLLGGSISVASTPGSGSTFTVRLPVLAAGAGLRLSDSSTNGATPPQPAPAR